jgi:glutathione-regulated potassium-efflux system ancillary protein KefG
MKKILILFAHPRLDRSEINTEMKKAVQNLPGITLVDLYAVYPTFDIDIDWEQQRLQENDIVVFQHPVYWYSCPAILKEWQDLVLEYGFAYGVGGDALKDKIFFNAVTCGGRSEAYTKKGGNHLELRDLFAPFEQTANLCQMRYLPPFVLYAAGHAKEENRLEKHIEDYTRLLTALSEDRVNFKQVEKKKILSEKLDQFILSKQEVW